MRRFGSEEVKSFTVLVGDGAGGLASGLARCLTFAAWGMILILVSCKKGLNMHVVQSFTHLISLKSRR